ncbi:hypothetical protein MINTM020_44810 [Mycobacterium paraintracellulare]|nr:hypothetical protein MINTM020_44810 [Mycobacterium paraintracellulare]
MNLAQIVGLVTSVETHRLVGLVTRESAFTRRERGLALDRERGLALDRERNRTAKKSAESRSAVTLAPGVHR